MKVETIGRAAEIVFDVLCAVGWLVGVIAWVRRGFGILKVVHLAAGALVVVGAVVVASVFNAGNTSIGFAVFALFGFPACAYAGWFLMGCPNEDKPAPSSGYDISHLQDHERKTKRG